MEGSALKLVHIHSGVLCSCKEKEILEFVGKWRELEKIIFSEVTYTQKGKCHILFLTCGS